MLARIAAADYNRAAVEPSLTGPAAHDAEQEQARPIEREQADAIIGREPEARIHPAELRKEHRGDQHQENNRPRHREPRTLADRIAKGLDLIDIRGLERDHRKACDREPG